MFSPMRLGTTAHPNDWRNYHGPVHRVLRNDTEVSAWSLRDEAERALRAAIDTEVKVERGRLPSNARGHFSVTETGVSYAPGGHVLWSVEFSLDEIEGARERPAG